MLPIALVINAIVATLLPDAAESYRLRVRARATGWIAGCTKTGSLLAQTLGVIGLMPSLAWGSVPKLVPLIVARGLVGHHGIETRRRDPRELEEPA